MILLILIHAAVFGAVWATARMGIAYIATVRANGRWSMPDWVGRCLSPLLPAAEWIRRRRRCRAIERTLPHITEMLALSIAAGAEFMGALVRIVERLPVGSARAEWQRLLQMIRVGQSRSVALRQMLERVPLPSLRTVVMALQQADRLGAPLVETLQSVADVLRAEQLERIERAGAVASQAVLVPIVFCIVPAALLLSLGGVLIGLAMGGEGMW